MTFKETKFIASFGVMCELYQNADIVSTKRLTDMVNQLHVLDRWGFDSHIRTGVLQLCSIKHSRLQAHICVWVGTRVLLFSHFPPFTNPDSWVIFSSFFCMNLAMDSQKI
jgi:hypothetical protein